MRCRGSEIEKWGLYSSDGSGIQNGRLRLSLAKSYERSLYKPEGMLAA